MTAHFILSLVLLLLLSVHSEALSPPERRRPQFQTEPGYYIIPTPYRLPGIGQGFALIGAATNVSESYADFYGFALTGGLSGFGAAVADIHLIPEKLILDLNGEMLSRASVTSYSQRGMRSDKDDFTRLDLGDIDFFGARLTSTFFDRRFEIYGGGYGSGQRLEKIKDNNGAVILEADNPETARSQVFVIGTRVDLTDDYADPRKGFRLEAGPWWSPPRSSGAPDYYRMDYNATAYTPIGRRSAWAFNYFRSDAHVVRKGETDPAVLEQEQGLDCGAIADPNQQRLCLQVIDNMIAANRLGTASGLGGRNRLRSYPEDRYSGAHTVFYGTEFRWNLTEEFTPFNIFIMKDVRTALQAAFFYEIGSVAESLSALGETLRSSYGAGFRMVTASGIVFRADVATGHEGVETTIIIGYPWESF
ncbi:MAG TPA: BamA/TamA family outer membrane protein [Candidatus Manganitrophaceae bacterium]|nr:BamA/TamA family outer membrane protein [Candidatus Manganitrophaceae bacterium]